jgi:hypothetical protein
MVGELLFLACFTFVVPDALVSVTDVRVFLFRVCVSVFLTIHVVLFIYVLTGGLMFPLLVAVLYHTVSNLQLSSLGWPDLFPSVRTAICC